MCDTLKTSWIIMICSCVLTLLLISGPFVAVAGSIDMDEASASVNTARKEVASCESQITTGRNKVSEFESLISKAEREIQDADCKLNQANANLRDLSERREVLADVQNKMRTVVTRLGVLAGVGNVAELQTRHLVLLEPVINVMEEMTTALDRMTGNQLLNTQGIKILVCCMKTNQNKLKRLADSKQRAGYDDYY